MRSVNAGSRLESAPRSEDEPISSWSNSTSSGTWVGSAPSAVAATRASTPAHDEHRLSSRGALTSSSDDAGQRAGREVVGHEVPAHDGSRVDTEWLATSSAKAPGVGITQPPDGAEVLLGVEGEPVGGDLAVEVDGQLGHAQEWVGR